jgi:hypothetical protein
VTAERRTTMIRLLLLGLIVADALVVYDAWRDTPAGQAFLARAQAKIKGCGGCARRRARLRQMVNRMHWDAERIVEGEDVPTIPEP